MAWISVHEQVIGGKLRELSKEIGCSQNEALGLLVRLWLWGINNADSKGLIIGADKADVAEILNVGIDKRYAPEKVVDALIETRWIDFEDGILFIHDWEEWQKQWYKALEVRARDASRKRKERLRKKNSDMQIAHAEQEKGMEEDIKTPDHINPPEEDGKKQPSPSYTKEFEEFWNVYPRKVGKGEAYKKYRTRLKDGWRPDELKQAAEKYSETCQREHTEQKFIKHAKTFLSDATPFKDYLPKVEVNSGGYDDSDPYSDWRE